MATFQIETVRKNQVNSRLPSNNWVGLGSWQKRDDAMVVAADLANELDRYIRVVRYTPHFEVLGGFNPGDRAR